MRSTCCHYPEGLVRWATVEGKDEEDSLSGLDYLEGLLSSTMPPEAMLVSAVYSAALSLNEA